MKNEDNIFEICINKIKQNNLSIFGDLYNNVLSLLDDKKIRSCNNCCNIHSDGFNIKDALKSFLLKEKRNQLIEYGKKCGDNFLNSL